MADEPIYSEQLMTGLRADEHLVMRALIEAWNRFVELPDVSADDQTDFRRAIHDAQRIMAGRIVAREYRGYWQ